MKLTRSLLALALTLSIIFPAFFFVQTTSVVAQETNAAMQRGYRTGYSDGYMAGYRDSIDSLAKDMSRHKEYDSADRAYNKEYGQIEDYRGGYRQGFASGYETGFDKKTFESSVPANLGRVGVNSTTQVQQPPVRESEPVQQQTTIRQNETTSIPEVVQPTEPAATSDNTLTTNGAPQTQLRNVSYSTNDGSLVIPKDTEIMIALQEDLSTDRTRQGERFTARVMSPMEFDGAIVEGHIEKVQIPGRIKRAAELQLTFDRIVMPDGRWSNFNGILTDITAVKGDNVRKVTNEGTAVGQGSIKGDAIKIGGATGAGAGVGAIVGGPVGAAVGAGIGAALGIGAAVSDRGKHIQLNANQQLKVRSTYETRIR